MPNLPWYAWAFISGGGAGAVCGSVAIVMQGLYKIRKLGPLGLKAGKDGVSVVSEDAAPEEVEPHERRVIDRDDGIAQLAEALAPRLREAITHDCAQRPLLEAMATGLPPTMRAAAALVTEAIEERKKNGILAESLPQIEKGIEAFRVLGAGRMVV